MAGFVKLFSQILDSTIWDEPWEVKGVWITLLAMADRDGLVMASVTGLARRATVTVDQAEVAIQKFLSPDRHSRTDDCEGRRIEVVDGGWRIINHAKYRDMRDDEDRREQNRLSQQRRRDRLKSQQSSSAVSTGQHESAQAEAEAEAVLPPPPPLPKPSPELPPPPSAPAEAATQGGKTAKRLRTTDLKPGSVEAFQAAWDAIPRTVMRRDPRQRKDVEEPVARGSRAQAERRFQALVDQGLATPRTLYVAFWAYLVEGEGPRKGYIQHMASFFGPDKATWREWLERAREIEAERFGEVS